MTKRIFVFCAVLCWAVSAVLAADVLTLKDGTKYEGEASIHPGYVEIKCADKLRQFFKTDVKDLNGSAVEPDRNPIVRISTEVGDLICELFEDDAPNTVSNFISLADAGFYRGLYFHRCIADFMIQGGCPKSRYNIPKDVRGEVGTGDPGYCIADEFSPNLRHDGRGILSMANHGPNTGGSQFFITFGPTPWLDGKHAVFGRVLEGWDTLTRLEGVASRDNDNGVPGAELVFNVQVITKRDHEYLVKTIPCK